MKKILILIAACALINTGVFAQQKMDGKHAHKMAQTDHQNDHLMMLNGKMVMIKSGKTIAMDKDVTLKDGTMVKKDGTLIMKNGHRTKMKNGDMVYMDGKMGKM